MKIHAYKTTDATINQINVGQLFILSNSTYEFMELLENDQDNEVATVLLYDIVSNSYEIHKIDHDEEFVLIEKDGF